MKDVLHTTADRSTQALQAMGQQLKDTSRTLWLAGLGAVAELETQTRRMGKTLAEQGEQLVRKGEDFQKRQGSELKERIKPINKQAHRLTEWVETTVDHTVVGARESFSGTLQRLGVPTHKDFEALNARLEQLTTQVERLAAAQTPKN